MLRKFLNDATGNIGLITAILALPLMLAAGISIDYATVYMKQSKLQDAADSAALAAVKELTVPGISDEQLQSVAESYVFAALGAAAKEGDIEISAEKIENKNSVSVNVDFYWSPMFAHLVDKSVLPIQAKAVGTLAGEGLTCVIGLLQPAPGQQAKSSIHMDSNSVLRADGCSVYSNSRHRLGLRADDRAAMYAKSICSAGGVLERGAADFYPYPITDCPVIDDPLVSRKGPNIGSCIETDLVITSDTVLKPGTYCGGISITGSAEVELTSGVYVIKDGPLHVKDSATLIGNFASFYLAGQNSIFIFESDTTIDLSATKQGPLAGLLVFEDRDVPYSFKFDPFDLGNLPGDVRLHRISSNNAKNLLGTIYTPRSLLLVNANAPVAEESAYTAIITGRMWLQEGPTLYLNADYTKTQVPVPDGLIGQKPVLTE